MRLIMGAIVFNEAEFIIDHYRYHYDLFDQLIYVDGAFAHFPHKYKDGSSEDGTLEILWALQRDEDPEKKVGIISCNHPWRSEMEKRSQYLQYGLPGDWIFVNDADMFIWGDIGRLRDHLPTVPEKYNVLSPAFVDYERDHVAPAYGMFCGLIRVIPGAYYFKNHWTIRFPGDKLHLGGPWFTSGRDYWKHVYLPWIGWKHFGRKNVQRDQAKIPYYQIHHQIEEIEPWKWSEEDWKLIELEDSCVNEKQRQELIGRRKGWLETKQKLEELGWNV